MRGKKEFILSKKNDISHPHTHKKVIRFYLFFSGVHENISFYNGRFSPMIPLFQQPPK